MQRYGLPPGSRWGCKNALLLALKPCCGVFSDNIWRVTTWERYGALTNEVGYITDIPWLLWIYRLKTTPSPSGCALGFRVVFDDKSIATMVYLLYILPHWSVRHTSSIDTAFNLTTTYGNGLFCLGMYGWTDCRMRNQQYDRVRLLIWPRPTSWWSCHTLNLSRRRLYSERFVDDRETRCAFEGCSSSQYGPVCKVGFDQFCCLDEL